MARTYSPPRSNMSHTPHYQPGPAELLEAGRIRARMMTSRHGITSKQTLEVVVRFGKMIDEAQQATSATHTTTQTIDGGHIR